MLNTHSLKKGRRPAAVYACACIRAHYLHGCIYYVLHVPHYTTEKQAARAAAETKVCTSQGSYSSLLPYSVGDTVQYRYAASCIAALQLQPVLAAYRTGGTVPVK